MFRFGYFLWFGSSFLRFNSLLNGTRAKGIFFIVSSTFFITTQSRVTIIIIIIILIEGNGLLGKLQDLRRHFSLLSYFVVVSKTVSMLVVHWKLLTFHSLARMIRDCPIV